MPHTETDTETIHFQCRHIFTDGHRCQSPTLRGPGAHENFCYYHHTTRRPIEHPKSRKSRQSTLTLPLLEDRSAIQLAIGEVLQKIAANGIDPRRAGLLLYGLQIASLNLKQDHRSASGSAHRDEPFEEAATVSEIVLDPLFGPLAPPAELHSTEPKGTAQLLLEEFDRRDAQLCGEEEEAAADEKETAPSLPSLHATAANSSSHHSHHQPHPQSLSTEWSASSRAYQPRPGKHVHEKSSRSIANPRRGRTFPRTKNSSSAEHAPGSSSLHSR